MQGRLDMLAPLLYSYLSLLNLGTWNVFIYFVIMERIKCVIIGNMNLTGYLAPTQITNYGIECLPSLTFTSFILQVNTFEKTIASNPPVISVDGFFNPLNPKLNPICYLLALLGAHHFLHVSRIRVKLLTLRLLMSYIYIYIYVYVYIWSAYSWCF